MAPSTGLTALKTLLCLVDLELIFAIHVQCHKLYAI